MTVLCAIATSVLLFTYRKPLTCLISFWLALKRFCKVTAKVTLILQIKKLRLQGFKGLT